MSKIYLFDVDGTLTPPKNTIDPNFKKTFHRWLKSKEAYIISGGSFTRIVGQLGHAIVNDCHGVFACMGNIFLQQIDTVEARIADYFGIKTTDTSALATHSIYVKVEETKNKILQTTLTNSLLQTVANRLESQVNSNSQHIYDTLKAYLMLHNQGPKDQNFLNNWFESEWSSSKSWPAAQQNIMSKSLNALLKLGIKSPQKIIFFFPLMKRYQLTH